MKNLPRRKSLFIGLNILILCVLAGSIAFSAYHLQLAYKLENGIALERAIIVRDFKIVNALTIISALMLAYTLFIYDRVVIGDLYLIEMQALSKTFAMLIIIVPLMLFCNWSFIEDLKKNVVDNFDKGLHVYNIILMAVFFILTAVSVCCLFWRDSREFGDLPPTGSLILRNNDEVAIMSHLNKKEEMSI